MTNESINEKKDPVDNEDICCMPVPGGLVWYKNSELPKDSNVGSVPFMSRWYEDDYTPKISRGIFDKEGLQ